MINFFKKMLGLPTEAEKEAAKTVDAPYKVEPPAPAPVVDTADIAIAQLPVQVAETTAPKKKAPKKQGPSKKQTSGKPRKPRAPKQPKA